MRAKGVKIITGLATASAMAADEPNPRPLAAGAAVEAAGLGHRFGQVEALEDLDLQVPATSVVALVGPSGCGKSTLLELIAGLTEPTTGRLEVGGRSSAPERLAQCVYMPQDDLLFPWLPAIDNAALPLTLSGTKRGQARERAHLLLDRLGLSGFERARPSELSGGMRQRVAFARTLLSGKPVLLLDEPFAALDALTRADLQSWLLGALAGEPRTVVLVTHDVEEALFVAGRVIVLSGRPGRAVLDLEAPEHHGRSRREVITSPQFTTARERALAELGGER